MRVEERIRGFILLSEPEIRRKRMVRRLRM
jgi:hypothetical protein